LSLGSKSRGSKSIDWKSTSFPFRHSRMLLAGIRLCHSLGSLDARLRGHDGLSLGLKAKDFNHPRERLFNEQVSFLAQ
jgi:hypothetical protein